jgi:hypothetical protein
MINSKIQMMELELISSGLLQKYLQLSEPQTLTLVSSEKTIRLQSSLVQLLWALAQFKTFEPCAFCYKERFFFNLGLEMHRSEQLQASRVAYFYFQIIKVPFYILGSFKSSKYKLPANVIATCSIYNGITTRWQWLHFWKPLAFITIDRSFFDSRDTFHDLGVRIARFQQVFDVVLSIFGNAACHRVEK